MKKIITFFKNQYYILTAILIFFSFPTYDIWFLKGYVFFAWFSLVPLFIYVRSKNFKAISIASFIAGLSGNFLVYNWIGNFGAAMDGGYFIILFFLIPGLTVFFATKVIISEFLSRKFERFGIFIYPGVWIIIDWIQSVGFLAFPWTYWGYSQYQFTPFIQMSSYTGIMGVTFIMIFTGKILSDLIYIYTEKDNQGFGSLIKRAEFKISAVLFLIFSFILGHGLIIINKNKISAERDIRLAVVQTCISPWDNWRSNRFIYLDYLEHYTKEALKKKPDMIIWSESATLETISYHYENGNLNEFEYKVLETAGTAKTPLLTGEIGITEDLIQKRNYPSNNAVYIDKDGGVAGSYAKINLVPFGEWFPYDKWFPFISGILEKFGASNFVPGDKPVLFDLLNHKFGILVCYEGIFYRLCRKYKEMGAEFYVNITNYGWTKTYAGHIQPFAAARFRAIENGIWFVSAGNTGLTALIDPYGRTVSSIPILKKGYLIADIDLKQNRDTFYSKFGDLLLYFCMTFIFFLCIILFYRYVRGAGFFHLNRK